VLITPPLATALRDRVRNLAAGAAWSSASAAMALGRAGARRSHPALAAQPGLPPTGPFPAMLGNRSVLSPIHSTLSHRGSPVRVVSKFVYLPFSHLMDAHKVVKVLTRHSY
jgi:hypothetical protein